MTVTIIFIAFLIMLAIMLAGMPIAVVMAFMGVVLAACLRLAGRWSTAPGRSCGAS